MMREKFRLILQKLRNDDGATSLEWVLLLALVAIPTVVIIRLGLEILLGHYEMILSLVSLPIT